MQDDAAAPLCSAGRQAPGSGSGLGDSSDKKVPGKQSALGGQIAPP